MGLAQQVVLSGIRLINQQCQILDLRIIHPVMVCYILYFFDQSEMPNFGRKDYTFNLGLLKLFYPYSVNYNPKGQILDLTQGIFFL